MVLSPCTPIKEDGALAHGTRAMIPSFISAGKSLLPSEHNPLLLEDILITLSNNQAPYI